MSDQNAPAAKTTAGAFDIRNIIGLLVGIYGVVLLALGLFADPELGKTGGVNANLYAGIGMVVVAAAFIAWARLKPIVVPAVAPEEPADAPARRADGPA